MSDHIRWLSRSLRPLLYTSFVYSCHFFLISSASVRSILSVLHHTHPWMKCSSKSPVFLKRSLVFPFMLFSSISLHCSLKKAFLSFLAILWNSAFSWVYLPLWASLVAQRLKRLPPMRETRVQSLGWVDPLEKEMVTHSSLENPMGREAS